MSSSRSSDEDKSKKKPAAVLAEEVRGRASKKEEPQEVNNHASENAVEAGPAPQRASKHVRSKSASFASMIIDNAQSFKHETTSNLMAPKALISEPARPQTSTTIDLESIPEFDPTDDQKSTTLHSFILSRPTMIRNESRASTLRPEVESRPSILGTFGSWLPWSRSDASPNPSFQGRKRGSSHAEGSLRDLLKATDSDRKGKSVDRSG
jgi:hypothetical protein